MKKKDLGWAIRDRLNPNEKKFKLVVGQKYFHTVEGEVVLDSIDLVPRITVKRHLFFWTKVVPDYELRVLFSQSQEGLIEYRAGWCSMSHFVNGLIDYCRFKRDLELAVHEELSA